MVFRAFRPRVPARYLHQSPVARYPSKAAQDKDSLKPQKTEYTQSGTDDSAAHQQTAFDPSETSPEQETATSERESSQPGGQLDASPANKDISHSPKGSREEGGATASKSKPSHGGSPKKAGGPKSG